jgi:hypothetical protein
MKQGRRPVKSELPRARPQRAGKQSPGTTFRFIPSEQLLSTGNATITYGQNRERIENMAEKCRSAKTPRSPCPGKYGNQRRSDRKFIFRGNGSLFHHRDLYGTLANRGLCD